MTARSTARTASPPKLSRENVVFLEQLSFPRPCLVAAIIFPHTKWLPKITDYRDTAALKFSLFDCCWIQLFLSFPELRTFLFCYLSSLQQLNEAAVLYERGEYWEKAATIHIQTNHGRRILCWFDWWLVPLSGDHCKHMILERNAK